MGTWIEEVRPLLLEIEVSIGWAGPPPCLFTLVYEGAKVRREQ
jgi:hypothetical protein